MYVYVFIPNVNLDSADLIKLINVLMKNIVKNSFEGRAIRLCSLRSHTNIITQSETLEIDEILFQPHQLTNRYDSQVYRLE